MNRQIKIKNESNRIQLKRRISGFMAAVLLITGIGATTYLQRREVYAKDTLESINKLVSSIKNEKPYNILEIVPDSVSFNKAILNYANEPVIISGEQKMSFMGYYVGGYEPVITDMDKLLNDDSYAENGYLYSTLSDSNLRYNMYDAITEPLLTRNTGIAYDANGLYNKDEKPVYIKDSDKYYEVREGEFFEGLNRPPTEVEFNFYVNHNGFKELKRDYYGTDRRGTGTAYVDIANGQMSNDLGIDNGNFARSYYLGAVSENNIAYDFLKKYLSYNAVYSELDDAELSDMLSEEDDNSDVLFINKDDNTANDQINTRRMTGFINDNFCYLSFNAARYEDEERKLVIESGEDRTNGMFDPNLRYIYPLSEYDTSTTVISDDDNTVSANVYAEFRYDENLTNGYMPEVVEEFDTGSEDGINRLKEYRDKYKDSNIPLYVKDGAGIYRYAGRIGDVIGYTTENNSVNNPADNSVIENIENNNDIIVDETEVNDNSDTSVITDTVVNPLAFSLVNENKPKISVLSDDKRSNITEKSETELSPVGELNDDVDQPEKDDKAGTISTIEDEKADELPERSTIGDESDELSDIYNVLPDNAVDTVDGVYCIIDFYYVKETKNISNDRKKFYSLDNFCFAGEGAGAQYVLDIDSPYGIIIPNLTGHGVIVILNECPDDYFIYDYVPGKGNYNFKGAGQATLPGDQVGSYKIRGAKIYYTMGITNNEWFKSYILDRDETEYSQVPVVVNSKNVYKVTMEDVSAADLVVIMSSDTTNCIGNYCEGYTFAKNDISYSALDNILYRLNKYQLPIVGDYRIVTDHEKKLKLDSTLKEPAISNLIKALELSQNDRTSYYLGLHTFGSANYKTAPFPADKTGDLNRLNNDNYVNRNIYIYNRKASAEEDADFVCFLNDKLNQDFGKNNPGFAEVKTDIDNENTFREAENLSKLEIIISQATAVRYIIGFNLKREKPKIKDKVKVLEIEPCASFDLTVTPDNETDQRGVYEGTQLILKGWNDWEQLLKSTRTNNTIWTRKYNKNKNKILYEINDTKIILTRMTTAEFIGRIEDINAEYDLIYIGMNTGLMNMRKATLSDVQNWPYRADYEGQFITDYISADAQNNPMMDGLVYCNVGDETEIKSEMGGMLSGEYTNNVIRAGELRNSNVKTRYSGNDITQEKSEALKNYVQAGYPVIIADDFYERVYSKDRWNGRSAQDKIGYNNTIDIYKIDQGSYMYDFVNSNEVKNKGNFMRLGNVNAENMDQYINLSKPSITLFERTLDSTSTPQSPFRDTASGKIKLPIYFMIENEGAVSATSKYEVNLLIDLNADGKYSMTREEVDFDVLETHSGTAVYKTQNVTPDVTPNGTYILEPGVRYDAECWLSDKFTGVIPWRLIVRQYYDESSDSSSSSSSERDIKRKAAGARRAVATGYYEATGTSKPTVKVLQINSVPLDDTTGHNTLYPTWNMEQQYNNHGMFYELLTNPVVPYDIQIKTLSATEFGAKSNYFKNLCSTMGYDASNLDTAQRAEMEGILNNIWQVGNRTKEDTKPQEWKDAEKEYLDYINENRYDMIIMGFSDCYVAPNSIAITAIKDYINSGRSVMFSHDCTSIINTLYDQSGNSGNVHVPRVWGYEYNSLLRNIMGMDRYNVLGEAKTEGNRFTKDSVYKPGYGRYDYAKDNTQIHGFTNGIINRELSYTRALKNVVSGDEDSVGISGTLTFDAQKDDMTVQKVNSGQITEYPYHLPDNFHIARTHDQYFQLDYTMDDDKDGESDIVVWYCLYGGTAEGWHKNPYLLTPNDVRNNYYIYNKGNVTYTGVGHSSFNENNEYETKLFVNTMVAAYRAGLQPPQVSFKSGYDGKRNTGNIYVSYDEEIELRRAHDSSAENRDQGGVLDTYKDIYFLPEQVSLVQNGVEHKISAKLYYKVPSGTGGTVINDIPAADPIHPPEVKPLSYDESNPDNSLIIGMWYYDKENNTVVDCSTLTGGITEALKDLKSGYVYRVRFNLSKMGKFMGEGADVLDSSSLFVVMTDSMHNQFTGAEASNTASAEAKFIRTEMFVLD